MIPLSDPNHYTIEILSDLFRLQCTYHEFSELTISLQHNKNIQTFHKSYRPFEKVEDKFSLVEGFCMFLSKWGYEQIKTQNQGLENRKIN